MANIHRVFRYDDGHEERDEPFFSRESYGIGETVERTGIRWVATERRALSVNEFEVFFVPDDASR